MWAISHLNNLEFHSQVDQLAVDTQAILSLKGLHLKYLQAAVDQQRNQEDLHTNLLPVYSKNMLKRNMFLHLLLLHPESHLDHLQRMFHHHHLLHDQFSKK